MHLNSSKPALLAALVAGALGIAPSAMAAFLVAESNTGKAELYGATGTYLGTFASGLSTPLGVAEGGGNVYIGSYGTGQTTKYSPSGTSLGVINSGADASWGLVGLAYTGGGRINQAFLDYSATGLVTSQLPDAGMENGSPGTVGVDYFYYQGGPAHGIASLVPNGFLGGAAAYTRQNNDGSGALTYWLPGIDAGNYVSFAAGSYARGVVAAGNNTFYVALGGLDKVVKVNYDGTSWVTSDFITGISSPVGVAIDGGNLYVSSYSGQTITGYSLANATQVSQFSTLSNPQYFTVTSIPEPGSCGLLAAGALLIIRRRRRQA